ncbi:protein kinase [Histoplasma capsulatum]|uniref:Protein kinase n=1 Tax=Ajellomyces capsulatus TaxID=5037 RepID=A0A8A1MBY8_AJECA|nr:protein kinase [Histoplasma capsulatum]
MSSNMSSPLKFADTGFDIVDTSKKFEEETLPDYHPADYYPARIGQVESRYVSLKISTAGYSTQNNEIDIYKQLESAALETDHVGKTLYRQLYGSFDITAPHGTTHTCLVQQPLGLSMDQYLDLRHPGLLSTDLLKPMLPSLLIALDFVHIAGVVLHTDFGDARLISKTQPGEFIMPHHYRAPEAILNMEWNDKVDIWNIAVLVTLGPRVTWPSFRCARIVEDGIQEVIRIAEMIAIMGPPPKEYLERSEGCKVFWDENAMLPSFDSTSSAFALFYLWKWKNLTPIPDITLESLAIDVQGEDKEGFLSFLRKILRWVPEERPTAGELVESSSTEGQKQWKYHKTFIQCKDETGTS